MASLTKDRLIFDPADLTESDNIGSYVRAGTDGDLISSTLVSGKEGLDVNVIGIDNIGIYAEDSVHITGDLGQFALAVQTASQGALAADGDYAPFQVDSQGRLRTVTDLDLAGDLVADDEVDSEDPLKIGYRSTDAALTALSAAGDKSNAISDIYRRLYINDSPNISSATTQVDVDNVAEVALPTTALDGRRRMQIQNLGPQDIYIGPTGVAVGDGFRVAKGATESLEIGEHVVLYAISSSATPSDIRVFELA